MEFLNKFRCKLKRYNYKQIDLNDDIFYSNIFNQSRYDREIDEGFGSGMVRMATIDISKLKYIKIIELINVIENYL